MFFVLAMFMLFMLVMFEFCWIVNLSFFQRQFYLANMANIRLGNINLITKLNN